MAGFPGVKEARVLGRVYTINPHQGECFYLRELSEYGLPQPKTVDNDRFAQVYHREIDYNQGEQEAYMLQVEQVRPF